MRKLYIRIYFAVLASLAVFALAAGLIWHQFGEGGPWNRAQELAATLALNALPPAGAPKAEQQAALEKLAANLRVDVALFAPDRSQLAAVGEPLEAFDRSIDVHVSRLRAAIEDDPKKPRRIITVRGAGYVFAKAQD